MGPNLIFRGYFFILCTVGVLAGAGESRPVDFSRVDQVIEKAIGDSAFPCAQIAVISKGEVVHRKEYGRYTFEDAAPTISNESMFDLASLTKVLATTTAFMKLYDDGLLGLDDPVSKYVPAFATGDKAKVTIRHLLSHTGGLRPFLDLQNVTDDASVALDSIFASTLIATPGDSVIYSDLGMIIMGEIIQIVSGSPLDRFLHREFYQPLGMKNTTFNPPPSIHDRVVPTEFDASWRKTLVRGQVHDERAALLGGVAGHAGLFSTAADISIYTKMILQGGTYGERRYLNEETIALCTRRQPHAGTRGLGWDTKSEKGSSAGEFFSPNSFGHTGFTGTSIWVDPDRDVAVIFLTNRVYPTRSNRKIYHIRPAVHNAVMEAFINAQ